MAGYFLRRILLIIPTFLGITLLVFSITRVVPGGPIERMMTQAQLVVKRAACTAAKAAAPSLMISWQSWSATTVLISPC